MSLDFKIGEWLVSPALNQISRNGASARVEPKSMQVLVYLAEHPGVVAKDQLISAVWPDVFVSDDALPGCISALRKAFDDNARQPKIIETIHKSGYRLLLPAETVSPNGTDQAKISLTELPSRPALSRRWALLTSAGLLVTALIGGLAWLSLRPRYDSIAVLPFLNMTGDTDAQYLSDGIAEEVVNDLSPLSNVRVVAWTTVSRYQREQSNVPAIGRDLGVKAVLVGRLLRERERVVLETELVDVVRGSQIWGERYERNISDIPGLQQQLSGDIATNLRIRLGGSEKNKLLHRYVGSPEAYESYLKGRFFSARRTKQDLELGINYFQQAIRVDPRCALAYAGLADSYTLLGDWGERAPRDSFPQARVAAYRAIALDDSLAEAHVSLAMVRELYDWDWVGAEQEFKRAIELNPNYPIAHQWYGLMLAILGRFTAAEAEVKRAQQLDPLSPIINMSVAEVYTWERRNDESIEQYQRVIALDPSFALAYVNLANAYQREHRYSEAVSAIEHGWNLNGNPSFSRNIERVFSKSGYSAVIHEELNRSLQEQAEGRYADPVDIAGSYAQLGEEEEALQWLQKGYEEHSSGMRFLNVLPDFDSVRSSAQFQYLLGVVGLAPVKPGMRAESSR